MKVDYWENFTCCSGTYIQDIADYHNLIYYKDPTSLYVNLYIPSEVKWNRPEGAVTLSQGTGYPETPTSMLKLSLGASQKFALKFRVPGWSHDMFLAVNGRPVAGSFNPGEWATIDRVWQNGDQVDITIPLHLRMEPVDRQHPERVAIVRGPVVLTLDANYHDPAFQLPRHAEQLTTWLVPENEPSVFAVKRPDGRAVRLKFRPFYAQPEDFPYRMYFDLNEQPYGLW